LDNADVVVLIYNNKKLTKTFRICYKTSLLDPKLNIASVILTSQIGASAILLLILGNLELGRLGGFIDIFI
jgi:hypothetical protein